jgi:hypothetical protein
VLIAKDTSGEWKIVHEDLLKACDDDDDQLAHWFGVLRHNGVKTVQDWKTARANVAEKTLTDTFGILFVALLDQLAIIRPAAAPRGMCVALVVWCPRVCLT